MRIINVLVVHAIISCLNAGCAQPSIESDDFSVSGTTAQVIALDEASSVTIICFCKNRTINKSRDDNNVVLTITGTHRSVGYHGDQDKPETISEDLLRFVERESDNAILLESKEYTYIHHAYIIDSLDISVPPDVKLNIKPISGGDLEGRSVEQK